MQCISTSASKPAGIFTVTLPLAVEKFIASAPSSLAIDTVTFRLLRGRWRLR